MTPGKREIIFLDPTPFLRIRSHDPNASISTAEAIPLDHAAKVQFLKKDFGANGKKFTPI
jgi:hypothetical protein